MAYKVFTNGSVLNASEINENLMNQSVSVFSSAAARNAAITSPVEGQLTYLEDVDRYESFSTSWSPAFGLTHITTQTVGTAVTSVTFNNVFSSAFDNYRVILTGIDGSLAPIMAFRFGAAVTSYYGSIFYTHFDGTQTGYDRYNNFNFLGVSTTGTNNDTSSSFDVYSPFLERPSSLSGTYFAGNYTGFFSGTHSGNTSFTSFTIFPGLGNITGGTISVYGYKKA